jgi:hypothetical protein
MHTYNMWSLQLQLSSIVISRTLSTWSASWLCQGTVISTSRSTENTLDPPQETSYQALTSPAIVSALSAIIQLSQSAQVHV